MFHLLFKIIVFLLGVSLQTENVFTKKIDNSRIRSSPTGSLAYFILANDPTQSRGKSSQSNSENVAHSTQQSSSANYELIDAGSLTDNDDSGIGSKGAASEGYANYAGDNQDHGYQELAAYPEGTSYYTTRPAPVHFQPVSYQKAPVALSPVLVPQPQRVPVALAPVPASSSNSLSLGIALPNLNLASTSKLNGLSEIFDKLDGIGSSLPSVSLQVPDTAVAKLLLQQFISNSDKLLPTIRISPKIPIIASQPKVISQVAPIPAPAPVAVPSRSFSKFRLPELPKLNSNFGGLSELLSKLPKFEITKRERINAKPIVLPAPVAVPIPNKIVTAYPLQKGALNGHVVVEDFPYGRPQYGSYDDGGEAPLGCAELDTAVAIPVAGPVSYSANKYK